MTKIVKIREHEIGSGAPCHVIAEIGMNHCGDISLGMEMIGAAAESGADAVKFQTFTAADLAMKNAPHYSLIKGMELDFDNHARLAECAKQYDVEFLSTPFSPAAVDLLERLNVAAYKIASMDVTHIPLIERVSKTKKPIILSTGMASSEEIKSALSIIDRHQSAVILLHCVSHYPCQEEHAQLNRIKSLQKAFGWNVGYSDHVQGIRAACAAVSMGACVVEKHFTIDRKLPGPDHAMSSDPKELSELVREIRSIEICLGIGKFGDAQSDRDQAPLFRRGIYAAEKILAGELVVPDMIKFVRPETSLRPEDAHKILGKKAVRTIDAETALDMDDVVII